MCFTLVSVDGQVKFPTGVVKSVHLSGRSDSPAICQWVTAQTSLTARVDPIKYRVVMGISRSATFERKRVL